MSYRLSLNGIFASRQEVDFDFEDFAKKCGVENIRVERENLETGWTKMSLFASTDDPDAADKLRNKIESMFRYANVHKLELTTSSP